MEDVKIGVGFGQWYSGLPSPDRILHYAERAEQLGLDSIWLSDHMISQRPELDLTAVMAAFAARTDRIKMGPSVLSLPPRNPIEVAHAYATLDYLTGGNERVIMAVGLGNDPRSTEVMGFASEERAGRLEEGVQILRRLWTETIVSFQGEYYQLDDVTVSPRPANGALDIWVGGNSEAALRRVARVGDGWFPALIPPDQFRRGLETMLAFCEETGRTVERDEAGMLLLSYVHEDQDRVDRVVEEFLERQELGLCREELEDRTAFGSPQRCRELVQQYIDAGCTKFVLFPIGPPEDLLDQLDLYGRSIAPQFMDPMPPE